MRIFFLQNEINNEIWAFLAQNTKRNLAVEDIIHAADESKASENVPDKIADDLYNLAHVADVLLAHKETLLRTSFIP